MKLELLLKTELKTIVNNHRINFVRIITANRPDMIVLKNYIINQTRFFNSRYDYTLSHRIFFILNNMKTFTRCQNPKCHVKGGMILDRPKDFRNINLGLQKFCSMKCSIDVTLDKDHRDMVKIKRYGDKNYNNTSLRNKTNLLKYGNISSLRGKEALEKTKRTLLDKYGVENASQSEIVKLKKEKTTLLHYGVKNPFQSEIIKKFCNTKEAQNKIIDTKRRNGTFKTSKPEDECYSILCNKFGVNDVQRQYNLDQRYPFHCDFYIKSKDIFIEYNGCWLHGKHPYDNKNKNDLRIVRKWRYRSKHSKFYRKAIEVWTKRDVLKRKTAIKNNINFVELWTIDDVNNWISNVV